MSSNEPLQRLIKKKMKNTFGAVSNEEAGATDAEQTLASCGDWKVQKNNNANKDDR